MITKVNGAGLWFVGAVMMGAILSGVTGCGRTGAKPPWPPPGFTAPVNGVSFRLDLRPTGKGTFDQVFSIASRRPDVGLRFNTSQHMLSLRVFREDGTEVAPSVVRPIVMSARGTVGQDGPDGCMTVIWPSPSWPDATYQLEDGTRVKYGKHTLDVFTQAWDLAPGKYTVRGRFRSKSAEEEPYGRGYTKTEQGGEKPAVYWAGDVELTPVEIEVAQ